ncbi:LURP-one-related/scramblase family protein [Lacticaseibacillus sp. GG6-2]
MLYYIDAQSLKDAGMSVVKDGDFKPVYILNGRHGIANDGFNLHTIAGQELGEIRQKTVGLFPRYDLFVNREKVGSIKKMAGVWREFIFVSDLNWMIIGNLLANQYHIYHGVKSITTIAEAGTASNTVFKLDIPNAADVPAGLLLAAILDRWRQVHNANPLAHHDNVGISFGM